MKKIWLIPAALAVLSLAACGESDLRRSIEDMVVSNAQVWVSGYYISSGLNKPCYWINDASPTPLDVPAPEQGIAWGVLPAGPDVYTAGYTTVGAVTNACYWKNAARSALTDGTQYSEARALCMKDKVLYFAGYQNDLPIYWTNDPATPPAKLDSPFGAAYGICADSTGIYICGFTASGTDSNACYWYGNGQRTDLPGNSGTAWSIFHANSSTYTAGCYHPGSISVPCSWRDGNQNPLPVAGVEGSGQSIFVDHGTVYVGGSHTVGSYDAPCYWVNGARVDLQGGGSLDAYVSSIFVYAGRVFAAGFYRTAAGDVPCVWRDGQRRDLPGYGRAYSIHVE